MWHSARSDKIQHGGTFARGWRVVTKCHQLYFKHFTGIECLDIKWSDDQETVVIASDGRSNPCRRLSFQIFRVNRALKCDFFMQLNFSHYKLYNTVSDRRKCSAYISLFILKVRHFKQTGTCNLLGWNRNKPKCWGGYKQADCTTSTKVKGNQEVHVELLFT